LEYYYNCIGKAVVCLEYYYNCIGKAVVCLFDGV